MPAQIECYLEGAQYKCSITLNASISSIYTLTRRCMHSKEPCDCLFRFSVTSTSTDDRPWSTRRVRTFRGLSGQSHLSLLTLLQALRISGCRSNRSASILHAVSID